MEQLTTLETTETTPTIWYGCYDGNWVGAVQPDAMTHPAKFSRNLIKRIYAYALEKGYIQSSITLQVSQNLVQYLLCQDDDTVPIAENQHKGSGVTPVPVRPGGSQNSSNALPPSARPAESSSTILPMLQKSTVAKNASTTETEELSLRYVNSVAKSLSPGLLLADSTAQPNALKKPSLETNTKKAKSKRPEPSKKVTQELAETLIGSGEAESISNTTELNGKNLAENSEMKLANAKCVDQQITSRSTIKSPTDIARATPEKTWRYYALPATEKLISLLTELSPSFTLNGKKAWLKSKETIRFYGPDPLEDGDTITIMGDTILDPFGGVGLGALDALANGLSWVGCELEARFVDIGAGVQCTGISKADWVRFYGRWDRANYKDGRHWCPRCLAEARQVSEGSRGQMSFFEPAPTAAYVRNSGIIPETKPHYYQGNLDLFKRYAKGGAQAALLKGDSRFLRRVIVEAGGVVSSPPYANGCAHTGGTDPNPEHIQGGKNGVYGANYSQSPDNLGNLPAGDLDGLLSSPPYINTNVGNGDGENELRRLREKASRGELNGEHLRLAQQGRLSPNEQANLAHYGQADGQLGAMKEGDLDGLLSSPPFAGNTGGRGEASRNGIDAALFDRHSGGMKRGTGESADNLDHLPMKDFEAVVGSPPFLYTNGGRNDPNLSRDLPGVMERRLATRRNGYGDSDGQLSDLSEGDFDAALSSPPFADSVGSDDPAKRGGLYRDPRRAGDRSLTASYGTTEGQLGAMSGGQFDGLAGSPPFENSIHSIEKGGTLATNGVNPDGSHRGGSIVTGDYGSTSGQLGTEQGQTFWAAAKQIVSECFHLLKSDSYQFWVCKGFVRDGELVDFPAQWRQLCEAVGFEFVEEIRAMQVSEVRYQASLEGESRLLQKQNKSFFRRLAEKNGSPRIDWETVIVMRKP